MGPCKECHRDYESAKLHIGKSSAGWCFSLHVYPRPDYSSIALDIKDLDDWKKYFSFPGSYIEDEYGSKISVKEMLDNIENRSGCIDDLPADERGRFYTANGACKGPNGLARHNISQHCISHGEGTYDYIIGEFC